jgi:hypothetical protein
MKELKRLWIPLLLGAVLMATLVGVASARPSARPLQQPWRVLTVPVQNCDPQEETVDYRHQSDCLLCEAGACLFFCSLDFPAAGEQAVGAVNVKRLTLYAYDNDTGGGDWVSASLYKSYGPSAGGNTVMATASTMGSDSTADPQTVMDTSIVDNPIYRVQGNFLTMYIGDTTLKAYAVHIHYTW